MGSFFLLLLLILVLEPPFDTPPLVASGDCTSSGAPAWPGARLMLSLGMVGMGLAFVVGVMESVVVAADSSLGSVGLVGSVGLGGCPLSIPV